MSDDRSLCLYSSRIGVSCVLSHKELNAWQLEDAIESCLDHEVDDAPVVHIADRNDAHLLKCRKPEVPPQTILGIWEESISSGTNQEDEEGQANPPVVLSIYESNSETDGELQEQQQCSCTAPHSEWTRTKELPPNDDGSSNQTIHMKWVDIRQWQKDEGKNKALLENPASLCHFTRTLLGSTHAASPWVECSSQQEPDVVVLVMMRRYPQLLTDFRIGDASPSFFLHSTSQLNLVPNDAAWIATKTTETIGTEEATLLVFRRLPSRDHLSVHHPLERNGEHTPVPFGCLWESYKLKENEEDQDEDGEQQETHYRLLGPPYVSHKPEYPSVLEPLLKKENFDAIRREAMSIPQWTAWPEKVHYSSSAEEEGASWTVFPLCHCFPANLVENRKWIESTCSYVPQTAALLKRTLGNTLRTALFSRLNPQSTLEPHTGWKDLANHVYRVHIPLVVPPGGLCGTWVDGCVETHEVGRIVCFDDAKVHRAFNYSNEERVVLIVDLARPEALPAGTATGGHTDELDNFINQLT